MQLVDDDSHVVAKPHPDVQVIAFVGPCSSVVVGDKSQPRRAVSSSPLRRVFGHDCSCDCAAAPLQRGRL